MPVENAIRVPPLERLLDMSMRSIDRVHHCVARRLHGGAPNPVRMGNGGHSALYFLESLDGRPTGKPVTARHRDDDRDNRADTAPRLGIIASALPMTFHSSGLDNCRVRTRRRE
jgi:hypothetical protein